MEKSILMVKFPLPVINVNQSLINVAVLNTIPYYTTSVTVLAYKTIAHGCISKCNTDTRNTRTMNFFSMLLIIVESLQTNDAQAEFKQEHKTIINHDHQAVTDM